MAKIKNYYAGANSSIGFVSLYEDVCNGLQKVYILKGGPGSGKSTLMRKIGLQAMEKGLDLEYYHCSSDNMSLDGLIIPAAKVGIFDGTYPHILEPKYPGVVEKLVDLGQFRSDDMLFKHRDKIIATTDQIANYFAEVYDTYAEAKKLHLKREEIYKEAMDYKKANDVTNKLLANIFSKENGKLAKKSSIRKLFFGSATPKGIVNFIDNITEDVEKRYIIKGRPGSGKSTLMRKIAKKAEENGYDIHYFPCGFDPSSIDMIVLPELSVCIIDGTSPHEVEPYRKTDEVVDMFQLCIDPTVEKDARAAQIEQLNIEYKMRMTKATNFLAEAKRLHDELESYYIPAMDFEKVEEKQKEIWGEIAEIVNNIC